jgi:hypothetical protein
MGFEDEAEQSLGRPCRLTDSRSKRTYELTSSIVPRGTSFHHVGGIRVSPTGFDLALSCCCGFVSGPTEFGAVDDHAQSACPPAPPTAKLSPTSVFLSIMTSAPLIIGLLIRPHSPGNTKITTAVTNRVIK